MRGAMRGSETPRAWCWARAGLVSGPRKLNTVGTPSSRRGEAAWRMAGWNTGGKQKPMPASAMVWATPSGGRLMTTPRASSKSALPQRLEAARLPCLATRRPAPATTMADRVETLKVPARSPPVPTTSTRGPSIWNGVAARLDTAALPVEFSARQPNRSGRLALGVQGIPDRVEDRSWVEAEPVGDHGVQLGEALDKGSV